MCYGMARKTSLPLLFVLFLNDFCWKSLTQSVSSEATFVEMAYDGLESLPQMFLLLYANGTAICSKSEKNTESTHYSVGIFYQVAFVC